jgi:hypothetical protein
VPHFCDFFLSQEWEASALNQPELLKRNASVTRDKPCPGASRNSVKKAMIDFETRNLKVAKGEKANAGGLA